MTSPTKSNFILFPVQGSVPFLRRPASLVGRPSRFFGAVEKFRRDSRFFCFFRLARSFGRESEKAHKPPRRKIGNTFERAGLFEEVRRARDDFHPFFTMKRGKRLLVKQDDFMILAADDKKRRGANFAEPAQGQVGPAAARDDGCYRVVRLRRNDKRSGSACRSPEEPYGKAFRFRLADNPAKNASETLCKKIDIETILIFRILILGKQVYKKCCNTAILKGARNKGIARREAAATASVCEQHDARSTFRYYEYSGEHRILCCYAYFPLHMLAATIYTLIIGLNKIKVNASRKSYTEEQTGGSAPAPVEYCRRKAYDDSKQAPMPKSSVLKIFFYAIVLGLAGGGTALWWYYAARPLFSTPVAEPIPRKEEPVLILSKDVSEETPVSSFAPFGSATLSPDFFLDGAGTNIDSPEFFEADQPENTLLLVSGKGNDTVEVWQYPFEGKELPVLKRSSRPNGLGIDQERNFLLIGDSQEKLVEVRALPNLDILFNLGKDVLRPGETNVDTLTLRSGEKYLYATESHQVRVFNLDSGKQVYSFSPNVESIEEVLADSYHQIVYVPEEKGAGSERYPRGAVTAYHPDGRPYFRNGSNVFGKGVFAGDGEGITLYACHDADGKDNGKGFIIAADQAPAGKNGFEFFDRQSWQHLGTLILNGVSFTDGIDATSRPLPNSPQGLFAAVNNDKSTAVVSWARIEEATGLRCQ